MQEPAPVTPLPVPVADLERSTSLDTLRGVAVLGIFAMNIVAYALPSGAYTTTHNAAINQYAGDFTGFNAFAWWINHLVFDQKMMSIFSMLFGAGVVLQDQRLAARQGTQHASFAGTYYRRLGILFLLGMVHAYLIWFGDILVAYSLCGLLLYPMRKVRPRRLIAIGLVIFFVAVVINVGMGLMIGMIQRGGEEARALLDAGQTITESQKGMLEGWEQARPNMVPSAEKVLAEVTARRGDWIGNFKFNAGLAIFFQTFLFAIWTLWRALGLMLVGMALAKLGFFAARWQARTYATLAAIGYVIGLPVIALGATQLHARVGDVGFAFGLGAQYNYVGSLLVAFAHASVVMLICKSGVLRDLTARLAAVGRMAFTNYLMQSVLCTLIFFGFGLGYFAHFERAGAYLFVLGVWGIELLWSPLWLARFRFGPAEWLWRSLTYLRLQPLRR
ncbi:MAG: DUF418 domain-containing protein [Planctomycetota bacterium]